ncbi:hypothetical protein DHEL01_v212427 [Diaporthe helianthi]|uniref:M protein repeat protein n=1 Tax=Diaporthe helianthi TaxID=158607 RepID=A0A2P5HG06_DIAHE|nr:hypothetical protein DHEL01_v212427 [Diaporthe helianthi]
MADAQSKAEKLAAARKKAEELKKKKAAGAKAKKDKVPTDKKDDEPSAAAAGDSTEEKPKEDAQEDEAPPAVEPSTPAEAEPTTTASPFAPTDTDSPPHTAGGTTFESTADLEAKLLELEKELDAVKGARDEAQLTADALEQKVASLELLHKEDESQINRLQTDLAEARNENVDLKNKLQKSEAETLRLSKQENQDGGGTDNDNLDELEDEERKKLEARIRQLEAENSDLQRGIWQERRREMQPPMDDGTGQFTNVPLSPSMTRKQGGLGDFFTTGLNALTGGGGGHEHQDDDGFLDDDDDFDEDAFRKAQEETAKARIERIKEIKRGLKNWEGWRLDLVEGRRGGGEGLGEIFEI